MRPSKLLVLALIPTLIAVATAQERPAASNQDEPRAAAGAQDKKKTDPKNDDPAAREEHVIYVPYKNLSDVFEKQGASVLMPYAQFLEMWAKVLGPLAPPPAKPPINGIISRADYSGAVEGDLVRLSAKLTVEVLGDDWARLPVQFGDAAVGRATNDDGSVLWRGVGDGNYELLAHGRGKHTVTFELVARVQASTDGKSFTLQCPPVGVSNLDLTIPTGELAVQVTPRQTSEVNGGDKDKTKVQAVLGSTDRFTVTWQPKGGAAADMAGLASVTDTIVIDVGDGVVHSHATFDYQILRGALDELVVVMPADERLLDVQVPGLRDWQTEKLEGDQAGRQRLRVRLHAAAKDKLRLELRTESAIPEKEFAVAQFQVLGAARESGVIAVRSAEDVGLEFVTHTGVSRIDAADVPEPLRKPRSSFYKFFTPSFRLAVAASALEPRVVADSFLTVSLDKSRTTVRGDFKYDVTRAGIFAARYRLPAGFHVDEVQCEAMDRHEVTTEDDSQVLTVYLTKKVLGALAISVTVSEPRGVQSGDLDLPLIEPLGVLREQGLVGVIALDSLQVTSDPKKLEAARPATPAELAARGFNPQPPQGSSLAAAFAFARRPVKIGLATSERPRRVLATVGTTTSVKEDIVSVTTQVNYSIQFAGADTFRVAVPAGVADRVQIEGDGIKERRKADKPEDDGSVVWTVVLHSEALGSRGITITYDQKITVPEKGVTHEVQPVRVLDVDRETGEIAVLKDRALAIEAKQEGLEEIDPRELTLPAAGKDGEQPYLTYRYFRHPARLTLGVTKHELEGVVKTVVTRAYVEAVVSAEGPVSVRARYTVKSSERQRLAVTLPATRLLGVTVAGRSVLPEKAPSPAGAAPDDKSYFINVARSTGPDDAFPITVVYEAPAPDGGKLGYTDTLDFRLPQFDAGVKFQQLFVRLWLPDKYRAVGEPVGFTSGMRQIITPFGNALVQVASDNPDNWFGGDTATFDFRTDGHSYLYGSLNAPPALGVRYWKSAAMTLVGSLGVLLVGLALAFARLEAKVLSLLAGSLGGLLAELFWSEAVRSWLDACRIGLAGVIALWLVLFLLRVRRKMALGLAVASAGTALLGAAGVQAAEPPPSAPPSQPAVDQSAHADQPPPADQPSSGDSTEKGGQS
jgi:hypothetical protein